MDNRATQTLQKSISHLKTPGTRSVTRSNVHSEAPQIFGATVSNLVTGPVGTRDVFTLMDTFSVETSEVGWVDQVASPTC
jgi:hypothetical protein